jgi:hypothetical protein
MASFMISARADQDGFEIEVVEHEGAPQTILGFETLAEAEAWVVRRARLSCTADAAGFRVQWRF